MLPSSPSAELPWSGKLATPTSSHCDRCAAAGAARSVAVLACSPGCNEAQEKELINFKNPYQIKYNNKIYEINLVEIPSCRITSLSVLLNSYLFSVQNSENKNKDKFISPFM
jgi:hypothetical protein